MACGCTLHVHGSYTSAHTEGNRGEEVRHLQPYTVEEVADMLHVGRDKVYYLLRTGQLRSIKIFAGFACRVKERAERSAKASLKEAMHTVQSLANE
jgi:excisionase family DNA binding protein